MAPLDFESSRIFVQGLPTSLNDDEFKAHFSNQFPVTDVKLIPHRRIGYVGYKCPTDAAKAVKYHNKTFIRMSRIGVELARSPEQRQALKSKYGAAPENKRVKEDCQGHSGTTNSYKRRKLLIPQNGEWQAPLQDFLEVMQPASKSNLWGNQDAKEFHSISDEPSRDTKYVKLDSMPDNIGSETLHVKVEHEGKKQQEDILQEDQGTYITSSDRYYRPEDSVNEDQSTPASIKIAEESHINIPSLNQPIGCSDADWLRSRTSRLLGLVDDDDNAQAMLLPDNGKYEAKRLNTNDEKPETALVPTPSAQSDQNLHDRSGAEECASSSEVDAVGISNGRLFIRNLTYTTTEDDLREHFENSDCGAIDEIQVPLDRRSGQNKGFAYVQFHQLEMASKALQDLDCKPLQGRLLHLMPANKKRENVLDDFAISKLPLKKQQQIRRKAGATSSVFNWNSLYMNVDAVISSISDRLGVAKSEVIDPTSSDAAVKQAHAETNIIQETKAYLAANGVDLDAFKRKERGETTILIKNFSYGTQVEELRKLFEAHGDITKLLMPPSGTIAVVDFEYPGHASSAISGLAYRKFKDSILFLERAPKGLFDKIGHNAEMLDTSVKLAKPSATDLMDKHVTQEELNTATLFVRNLNFITTTERLREVFEPLDGFLSARVKTKADAKKPGQLLSMGFGFLEFRTKDSARVALATMDGYKLDGHELLIRASQRADAADDHRKADKAKKIASQKSKIIIKNLPFEASKKDVRSLFEAYGQLRSLRVPKKFDSTTRGFAFAEFITAGEAANAMAALENTHLLGRRLILEFAAGDAVDPEQEIEMMQRKVGKQVDKVALQRLTGSARKKFAVDELGEE